MKFLPRYSIRFLSLAATLVLFAAGRPASAQECPLIFPPSPSNDLTSYITQFPYATNSKQPLISYFLVDVTNEVNKTNYLNPPVPYGLYPAWCVDEWDDISPTQVTVPGSAYTGALFSTCDPNLNSELPPGHTNTLVSSTNWQMVNYILNHQTYDGTNAYYWSVQAAINTLVGSGAGSVGFCGVTLNTPIPDGSMPDGACGYPTYNPVVVNALLTAASNNYASWTPQCGDVYGAIYVTNPTNDQFLMLEVPIPCSPCVKITKQVACLQPGNTNGAFGPIAQGFAANCPGSGPGNNPAFVYEITVTNCGTIALTNVIISDNLLGDLTTNFFANSTNVFEPGASATMYFSMAFATNATNTVTVVGQAQLAETVTNLGQVYTNGYSVADTATAVALVTPASISCGLVLYSPLDLDGYPSNNDVLLPSAMYYSQPPSIDFSIEVCNSGDSALSAVTLNAPALTSLGFTLPSGFSLAAGQCTNFELGSAEVTCSNQTFFSLSTTAIVDPDTNHCAVYDLAGNPLYVCSSCVGTVECSTNTTGNCVGGVASVSGTVVLNCNVNDTNLNGDTPMSGVTVVLYGAISNSLATNITDLKGDYSFSNLSAGVYYIAVETATNYVETYPPGVTNGVASVTLVPCQNLTGVNFGYADTTPPQISVSVTNNQYFGCNPTNLPSDTNLAADVTAIVSCGTSNIVVTHVDTNMNCAYQRTYFITVTDTYGNTASTNVIFTWTSNSTPPAIYGAPTNAYLGCNPTNVPTDYTVTNGMTASNLCSLAPLTVTNYLTTNGCFVTNVFMITAIDSCGNSTSTNVVYSWTENTMPPVIAGTPTNAYLGCNPSNQPSISTVTNGMSASNACGSATLSVTPQFITNGCFVTNIFTITALDGCGNTSSTNVVYSWTENTTPPVIKGAPTNAYLGCNPTNLPTLSTITNGMSASNACSSVILIPTCTLTTNGCYRTNTFTIKATDGCGNTTSTNVVYSWTVNTTPPVIHGTPSGAQFGCNPTNLPTIATVTNGMSASSSCGSATLSVTPVLTNSGCYVTNIFKITATDGCGNATSTNVVYSWLSNLTGPIVNCPSNVTVITNICQMYCTFNACDWSGSCNGGSRYNNSWWQNYCGNNSSGNCYSSFTNWWSACGANANQCSTWCVNWNNNRPSNWWGSWANGGYQYGNWYNGWNNNSQNNQCFVPCAGSNPDGILNNCFNKVYTNGCITIGNTNNGNCLTFTSCSAAQNCLNWSGNCGVLNNCATNPSSCNAGCFGAQVLALQLNCDFGDYGCAPGYVGKCGDLVLSNPSSPCNGCKVRDILSACNRALGGGPCPQGCSVQYLCGLCSNLNQCFEGCQVSSWCSTNLCAVYIPTPAQTGAAVVTDACSPNPKVTYCDTVTPASCGGTYVISREWMAVDSCGNSNTCTQLITVAQTNSASVSGVVVLACGGDTNLSNNQGMTNVTVSLKNSQGSVIATTSTDVNGNYSFSGLAPGSYAVVVTPPNGYTETYPSSSGNDASVNVTACGNETVNFAYVGSTVGVQLIKTAPACMPCSGIITYCFAVTNTGNTCETLTVVDPLLGGTIFTQTSVAPGQGFLFSSNYTVGTSVCMLTNTAWAIGTGPTGKSATNSSSVTTCITTKCVTNEICGNFNSQNPGNGYVWCNAHLSCNPGKPCTIYCQNASVTFSCNDGKVYTFPVPNCKIKFTNCSSGSCSFDGANWNTTIPCSGDDQIFLSGCGIPWQSDFANCHSVCWTGVFCCDTAGVNCNWQWSAACYNNNNFANCGSVSVKPCHTVSCGYPSGDQCGTPENCKSSCQGGACGGGGSNYTGSWSSTGSFTCH